MTVRTIDVKLYGGPLDGRIVTLPGGAEKYVVGAASAPFWTYEYAGKDGQQVMFAKRPTPRIAVRFLRHFVGRTGRDPRIEAAFARGKPITGKTDKRGQGARRRAAKRDQHPDS